MGDTATGTFYTPNMADDPNSLPVTADFGMQDSVGDDVLKVLCASLWHAGFMCVLNL